MSYTARFCEQWELIDVLYGDAVAANTESNTGYNCLANFHRVVVIIHPVDVNDALNVDFEQGTTTAGAGPAKAFHASDHDVTIATTDDAPTVIEIQTEELDVTGGFDCLNVEVTTADTAGGGNDFAVEIWGYPRFLPASNTLIEEISD